MHNELDYNEVKQDILKSDLFVKLSKNHNSNQINDLHQVDAMERNEAERINNIWKLKFKDRQRLYIYWKNCFLERKTQYLEQQMQEYKHLKCRLDEVRDTHDSNICRRAAIIGMTTTGAAKFRRIVKSVEPRIVIVEEAAEVLEAHIVTSLTAQCEHLIMIGDHIQLRPKPSDYQIETKYRLGISLFERMVIKGMHCDSLDIQHRMRLEIVELLVPHFYKSLQSAESVSQYHDVWGVLGNLFFVAHNEEEDSIYEMRSHSNQHEAEFISAFCTYLLNVGFKSHQITVLTMYVGQVFLLKKYIPKTFVCENHNC